MNLVKDSSVHLIVTSPPYWQLKDYGSSSQIGFNDSYESYINNLNLVWNECARVLHPGCRLCVNIGDQFARSVYYGRYKVIPIRTEIIKFCECVGFDYMGAIIWQKVTNSNTTGGASIMGSFPYPRNGIIKLDYEFILIFKKLGDAPKPSKEQKDMAKLSTTEWNNYFSGHWNFSGARQDEHLAMFPEELPSRLIKMFTFPGEIVLDPFLGSGTTSLAAKNLSRNSIGYEINEKFLETIEKKLNVEQLDFSMTEYEFIKEEKEINFQSEISKLPYVFKDPHDLDKKVDIKKLSFGSKIDEHTAKREQYYSVKEVISSEFLKLNNDLVVRLLGVKEKKESNGCAVKFLQDKTKGQKVFMKFDKQKHDAGNNLLCYLYLENKTFLNAHLIKKGFAEPDDSMDYRLKEKFKNLRSQNV